MTTPLDFYHEQCTQGVITVDPEQEKVLQTFDRLYHDLVSEIPKRQGILSVLHRKKFIPGVYLWGRVGTGKTYMMDAFFQCLPFQYKMRMHFHNFMAMVHQELHLHQGKKNPLSKVADDVAGKAWVLCFDELTVSDITDAMLLGGLFDALFLRGVCLVATSNVPPDELYHNGLQRERFLSAINLIKKNTEVLYIPSEVDYRLRHQSELGTFFVPLDAAARAGMTESFAHFTQGKIVLREPVSIQGRSVPVIGRTDTVIWFDFKVICQVPRSQQDYLEIAAHYKTVLISDIPVISADEKDTICLFVSLVDIFYDARIRLIISAAEPVAELYRRGFMVMEYTRTHSRLLEMQSAAWFNAES